ncbi:MAG: hypothetical protein PHP95_15765 [Desulfuromonadaceae bacterium]|nr:hypothetical protein [Desulfuromonadaceae bacterium]MDD2849909.1 hypothetical protein [Desulfuromonadaceae bacterium]MDD4131733.1 hypothetical protein [Desulfuromonadaceae bacterium]
MKLVVDWFPSIWLGVVAAAVLRLNWYYYNGTKINKYEWNSLKMIKFYIDETKKENGRIGLTFWVLVVMPIMAFITLLMRIFYYKHM